MCHLTFNAIYKEELIYKSRWLAGKLYMNRQHEHVPQLVCHYSSSQPFKCLLQANLWAHYCSSVSSAMWSTPSNSSRLLSTRTTSSVSRQDKMLKLISIKSALANCLPHSTESLISLYIKKKKKIYLSFKLFHFQIQW